VYNTTIKYVALQRRDEKVAVRENLAGCSSIRPRLSRNPTMEAKKVSSNSTANEQESIASRLSELSASHVGSEVTFRYERRTTFPHHETVKERTATIERASDRAWGIECTTTVEYDGRVSDREMEYALYPDGEVFAREVDGHFRDRVKIGDLIDITVA
jgi:hypothetical protein